MARKTVLICDRCDTPSTTLVKVYFARTGQSPRSAGFEMCEQCVTDVTATPARWERRLELREVS